MSSGTGKRILTAAVLIPVVMVTVWLGPNWLIALVSACVAVLAIWEFFAVAEHQGLHAYRLWTSLAAVGIIAQQFYASRMASVTNLGDILIRVPRVSLEMVFFAFVLGVAAISLGSRRPLGEVLPAISVSAGALIFIVLPFSAVVRLHGVDTLGPLLLLFTLLVVWVGDTVAYFVGRGIGRWKLAPVISPNKTWEGAIANFLGALLVAAIFGYWSLIPPVHMLIMAGLGSVAGQIGDLFESAWKRSASVKDSGSILPGHGGMLDRIDALILAAPAIWYYFEWIVWKRN